jgi:hypothetical protein
VSGGTPAELPVVILMTSNGAGMGHLARQAAVAASARADGRFTPVLLSMSSALPVVAAAIPAAARAEYCPGPTRGWMPADQWHRYLRRRLVALVREVGASALVFDGTSPYPGLLAARRALPDLHMVWSRRGLWRPDASRAPLRSSSYFDRVVEPGDLAAAADRGPTRGESDPTRIGPVTLLETLGLGGAGPALTRGPARAALGLDPDRPAMLVTLGAGSINDPSAAVAAAVAATAAAPDWQVALTRAPIALRGLPDEVRSRVTVLEGVFPLASVLSAFDAAVSAAGYNAAHELVLSGIPTVLVPNTATSTDDQVARARYLAARGWALIAAEDDPIAVAAAVADLLESDVRADLREATAWLPRPTGASALAANAGRLAADGTAPALPRDLYRPVRGASTQVRRLVGEAAWERARQMSGAPARLAGGRPAPVMETAGPVPEGVRRLLVTHDLTDVGGSADVAVEHILEGSSADYLAVRRAIIADSYDGVRR